MQNANQPNQQQREIFLYQSDHPILERGNKIVSGLSSYLPLISTLLLAFSLIRVYLYYSYFQINILDYINLTELLSPLLLDLASLIILVGLILISFSFGRFLMLRFANVFPMVENRQVTINQKVYRSLFFLVPYHFFALAGTLATLGLPMVVVGYFFLDLLPYLNIRILQYALFTTMGCLFLAAYIFGVVYKKTIHIYHWILVSLMAVMFVSAIVEGYSLPSEFYADKKLHTTRIIFEDSPEPLKLDSIFVIGLTQDYVFLYNDKVKMPQVRKRSDIKIMSPGVLPLSNASPVGRVKRK